MHYNNADIQYQFELTVSRSLPDKDAMLRFAIEASVLSSALLLPFERLSLVTDMETSSWL